MNPRRCPVCWQTVRATYNGSRVSHHLICGRACEMSGRGFALCYPLTVDAKSPGVAA